MKAEKEETSWPLDVAGKGSLQAFVQVPMKGIKDKSSAHKPVIIYMVREKEAAYWMEEMALSM